MFTVFTLLLLYLYLIELDFIVIKLLIFFCYTQISNIGLIISLIQMLLNILRIFIDYIIFIRLDCLDYSQSFL